jgi:hypothetical protein
MFSSSAGATPGGQSNTEDHVTMEVEPGYWNYLQLIPFKLTDSNGNPRVGFPVTLSVYSITTKNPTDFTIDFLVDPVSEPNQQTITTDSAGQGIFNAIMNMSYIHENETKTVNVVLKATTNDAPPITAYLGLSYTFTSMTTSRATAKNARF